MHTIPLAGNVLSVIVLNSGSDHSWGPFTPVIDRSEHVPSTQGHHSRAQGPCWTDAQAGLTEPSEVQES